jgi:hypothetical protein
MNKTILTLALTLGITSFGIIFPATARADTLLNGVSSIGQYGGDGSTIGYTFHVGPNNLNVYSLGSTGGLGVSQFNIGLWDSSGNLMASTLVSLSETTFQQFVWNTISPVNLQSGQDYTLGSVGYPFGSSVSVIGIGPATGLTPYVSIVGAGMGNSMYNLTDPIYQFSYFKSYNAAGYVAVGPNMQFTAIPNATPAPTPDAVPEPSTYALFGIGAIGLLMVMRKKKAV